MDFELDKVPFYKRGKFWLVLGPLLVSLAFVIAVSGGGSGMGCRVAEASRFGVEWSGVE